MEELKQSGTLELTFTGGEIFLRHDLLEIIEHARGLGFNVSLFTNATMIGEEIVRQLSKLYIHYISITIYSLNEDIQDRITMKKGTLKNILDSLDLFDKYGIKVQVKTPLMKLNMNSYIELKRFCETRGYTYVANTMLLSKTNKDKTPLNYMIEGDDLARVVNDIDEYNKSKGYERKLNVFDREQIICRNLSCSLFIDDRGNVYPCISYRYLIGNIHNSSISEILRNPRLEEIQELKYETLTKCGDCVYFEYCDRCPGIAYFEEIDQNGCSQTARKIAVARYRAMKGGEKND